MFILKLKNANKYIAIPSIAVFQLVISEKLLNFDDDSSQTPELGWSGPTSHVVTLFLPNGSMVEPAGCSLRVFCWWLGRNNWLSRKWWRSFHFRDVIGDNYPTIWDGSEHGVYGNFNRRAIINKGVLIQQWILLGELHGISHAMRWYNHRTTHSPYKW